MEKTLQEQQIEAMQTANEYIEKLINGINMCMDTIREEKNDEATNLLSYIVEGIEWISEIIRLTKEIQKENMDEEVMKEFYLYLNKKIHENDFDKVIYIFNDKILPLLKEWEKIISDSMAS